MKYLVDTVISKLCTSVYGVLAACCALVYTVISINSWSWHCEIDRDVLTVFAYVIVVLRTRKREMNGDGRNHHDKLGLRRVTFASQCSISGTAGMSSDPAGNSTNSRSSHPNQASCYLNFSYPLIFCTSSLSSFSIPFSLVPNCTIIAEHEVMTSLSISPCHDYKFTLSIAYAKHSIHQVQHTPSTAYTKYRIYKVHPTPSTACTKYNMHWVKHTPCTAFTEYSIHPILYSIPSFT
jgi:hypothetical protein